MTTVTCNFCSRTVENPQGWHLCKNCYEDGTYYKWVVGQIRNGQKPEGMVQAYHFMRKDRGLMQILGYPPRIQDKWLA
jgi:hypothetical protein